MNKHWLARHQRPPLLDGGRWHHDKEQLNGVEHKYSIEKVLLIQQIKVGFGYRYERTSYIHLATFALPTMQSTTQAIEQMFLQWFKMFLWFCSVSEV